VGRMSPCLIFIRIYSAIKPRHGQGFFLLSFLPRNRQGVEPGHRLDRKGVIPPPDAPLKSFASGQLGQFAVVLTVDNADHEPDGACGESDGRDSVAGDSEGGLPSL